jgi:hypothetical protein
MKAIIEHAREIAGPLGQSLANLEVRATAAAIDTARRAIRDVWLTVVDDVANGRAILSSAYLATVHARLTTAAGSEDSTSFAEHGLPILPDGGRKSWSRFAQECRYEDDNEGLEEEYALAQLRWGEHVRTFALSLGWFAMNVVRLRRGEHAVYPPPADHERLLKFLEYAGPDTYDAEAGLRGLAREYARQQAPGVSGIA